MSLSGSVPGAGYENFCVGPELALLLFWALHPPPGAGAVLGVGREAPCSLLGVWMAAFLQSLSWLPFHSPLLPSLCHVVRWPRLPSQAGDTICSLGNLGNLVHVLLPGALLSILNKTGSSTNP